MTTKTGDRRGWTPMDALRPSGGGGTESNRARAARGGFAFTMPSEPGQSVIARLDTTGDEPVGSVSRDGGQTWEDAPAWPAPVDALPSVKVMSAWRRPDGALVAEGSDGVDRVTKPGEIRTPEDADRLFGKGFGLGAWMRANAGAAVFRVDDLTPGADGPVQHGRHISGEREMVAAYGGTGRCPTPEEAEQLYGRGSDMALRVRAAWELSERGADGAPEMLPPMTWGGVPVPFERVDTARAPAGKQPTPAPAQVWLPPVGAVPMHWRTADGTVTIAATPASDRYVTIEGALPGHEWRVFVPNIAADGWTCVGVATPHGRVMVGDGWRLDSDAPEWTVSAVGYPPGTVVLSAPNAGSCSNDAAHVAARWQRTRYAPARAGERLRRRTNGAVYTVTLAGELVILDAPSGARDVYDAGPGGWAADPAQWERLDPGTVASTRDGQTIRINRPASVVEAERARAVGAADAETDDAMRARCFTVERGRAIKAPGLDTATGAALDAIASDMGIERREGVAHADDVEARARTVADYAAKSGNITYRFKVASAGADETRAALQRIEGAAHVAATILLRREIDALIAADVGQPFAHARAATLRSWGEQHRPTGLPPQRPAERMAALVAYEAQRGGTRTPTAAATEFAEQEIGSRTIVVYERERGRSDVQARRVG